MEAGRTMTDDEQGPLEAFFAELRAGIAAQADPAQHAKAMADYEAMCRKVDTDPAERARIDAIVAEIEADDALERMIVQADEELRACFADLIERSSLGTPAAKKLRAQTSSAVVTEILRRARLKETGCDGGDFREP
jgi:uncharacterized membrane-anchored protein YjiN (DUF445 family)